MVNVSLISISSNGRNVRYNGRALDKLGISHLIRSLAKKPYLLPSDIYWDVYTKAELVDMLRKYM